jgi:type II secretory pathway component PulF
MKNEGKKRFKKKVEKFFAFPMIVIILYLYVIISLLTYIVKWHS